MVGKLLLFLVVAFPVSEITLGIVKRARPDTAKVEDRGSMRLLWLTIFAALVPAIALQSYPAGRVPISQRYDQILAIGCMVFGLGIRWASIVTLGRLFTVDVAIQQDHAVIQSGLYRYIRHPSYAGLLLAFLGLGFSFASWLSLATLIIPITLAVANRISKEEAALRAALGAPYVDYCTRTKRLIPFLI